MSSENSNDESNEELESDEENNDISNSAFQETKTLKETQNQNIYKVVTSFNVVFLIILKKTGENFKLKNEVSESLITDKSLFLPMQGSFPIMSLGASLGIFQLPKVIKPIMNIIVFPNFNRWTNQKYHSSKLILICFLRKNF